MKKNTLKQRARQMAEKALMIFLIAASVAGSGSNVSKVCKTEITATVEVIK